MEAIGGRWKPVLLYHLMGGTRRFGEFRRLTPGVSQRMLTQHLRELERDGLVHREVYREAPPRVEYSLTARGRTMEPLLHQMNAWAMAHLVEVPGGAGEAESHAAALIGSSAGPKRARGHHGVEERPAIAPTRTTTDEKRAM